MLRIQAPSSLQLEALDIGGIHVLANRENLTVFDVDDPAVPIVIVLAVLETTGTVRLGDDLIPLSEQRLYRVLGILALEETAHRLQELVDDSLVPDVDAGARNIRAAHRLPSGLRVQNRPQALEILRIELLEKPSH